MSPGWGTGGLQPCEVSKLRSENFGHPAGGWPLFHSCGFFFPPNAFIGKSKPGRKKKKRHFDATLKARNITETPSVKLKPQGLGRIFSGKAYKSYDKSSSQAACHCSPIWEPWGDPGHHWRWEGHHTRLSRGEIVCKCSTGYVVGPEAVGCFAKCQEWEIWEIRWQSQSAFQVCDFLIPGGAGNGLKVKFRCCLTTQKAEGK